MIVNIDCQREEMEEHLGDMSERDFLLGVTKVERPTVNVDSTSPWVGVQDRIKRGK